MIAFSRPATFSDEAKYIAQVLESRTPWGGGAFFTKASNQVGSMHNVADVLLTQSCTSALELAALGLGVEEGDEVIVPSYTFVTSASAFALRGAKIVFVDSEPDTLNIDVEKLESLITSKTKVIVVVHYGGVACDMDRVMKLARDHGIFVVEDAAQGIGATYKGKPLGSIGDVGCLSFHGTKNVSSGEGGALLVNTKIPELIERFHTAHEKGTDRAKFLRGEVDKYTWRQLGSSFIPSEFTCAVLSAQLENFELIQARRRVAWDGYAEILKGAGNLGYRILNQDKPGSNLHMFALVAPSPHERERLRVELRNEDIIAASHYEPLHQSPFARQTWCDSRTLPVAEQLSGRVLRLPLWSENGLEFERIAAIALQVIERGGEGK